MTTASHAFAGCTSLLPPSLSYGGEGPAAVLAYLKRKSFLEHPPLRYAIYASVLVACKQEGSRVAERGPPPPSRPVVSAPHPLHSHNS
jgi:hypothetical protein